MWTNFGLNTTPNDNFFVGHIFFICPDFKAQGETGLKTHLTVENLVNYMGESDTLRNMVVATVKQVSSSVRTSAGTPCLFNVVISQSTQYWKII